MRTREFVTLLILVAVLLSGRGMADDPCAPPPPPPPPPPGTAVDVDLYWDGEAGAIGEPVTSALLTSVVHGPVAWTANPNPSAAMTVAGVDFPLPKPLAVAGVTYDGVGTRGISYNHAASSNDRAEFLLPALQARYADAVTLDLGPIGTTWAQIDFPTTIDANGQACAAILRDKPDGQYTLLAHTSGALGTRFGAEIVIPTGAIVRMAKDHNSITGVCDVLVFDAFPPFTLIGQSTAPIQPGVLVKRVRPFGVNAHGSTPPVTSFFDDYAASWTTPVHPLGF